MQSKANACDNDGGRTGDQGVSDKQVDRFHFMFGGLTIDFVKISHNLFELNLKNNQTDKNNGQRPRGTAE